MFLPTTQKELQSLGWKKLDVILVTGDAYIDSPHIGVAVIGKILLDAGFRVGIIAQPDITGDRDICRLGEPELFWGVTAGCMDSMISNYTATKKKRRNDDLTAGGKNTKRPDMAVIVYTNLIRRFFKKTKPVILGGIEASLRRISHYHYPSDSIRRSILFDAKADILVYGMGEKTVLEIADNLRHKKPVNHIRGICYIAGEKKEGYIELPAHKEAAKNKTSFSKMFHLFYQHNDSYTAKGLCQQQDTRYLIHNPPQFPLTTKELDHIHELGYERDVHPCHKPEGHVRALDTIRFSMITHRGCYGECNFCSIAVHQGKMINERSEASILREAEHMTRHPDFKGIIQDVGGPTANMYGIACARGKKHGPCPKKHCLTPKLCKTLTPNHHRQIELLRKLRKLPNVKRVFIGSGIRHDLILADHTYGKKYLEEILQHHVSGQFKIAPEHSESHILKLMGKPNADTFTSFVRLYNRINSALEKKQFITCYFIAAYPGCTLEDMHRLKEFTRKVLKFKPEQVQIFTPSPSTLATLMYYTETSIHKNTPLFVEKNIKQKEKQKKEIQA